MMRVFLCLICVIGISGCAGYKRPSGNASSMSADTLCYRYAYAKANEAYAEEIAARGLDCRAILSEQGPIGGSQYY